MYSTKEIIKYIGFQIVDIESFNQTKDIDKVEVLCPECKHIFLTKKHDILGEYKRSYRKGNTSYKRFCSDRCYKISKNQNVSVKKECEECKKEFFGGEERKYCSKDCWRNGVENKQFKELIEKGFVKIISEIEHKRNCPNCNKEIIHKGNDSYRIACNSTLDKLCCPLCVGEANKGKWSGELNPNYGKGYLKMGENNSFYGKTHTEENKKIISENRKKQIFTKEHFDKISKHHKGRKLGPPSEETKNKIRIKVCERLIKLGIPSNKDKGADEFFESVNKKGFNFQQNYYLDKLGYFADGYDEEKHIICEYDTPYHFRRYTKEKDLIRQNNIINYFESIKNPLNGFVRVKDFQNGKFVLEEIIKNYTKEII